jgi:hypothetical protein
MKLIFRSLLFVLTLTFAASLFTVQAKPHTFGNQLSASQCDPSGHHMVLNVVFQVTNDADSGVAGNYWALDSYTKHVQVWDMGGGGFCAQVKYNGSFVTVAGISPGNTGLVTAGITGTMEGGYNATFTGSFTPGTKRTKGNIGSKDNACTITGGVPSCGDIYSWASEYFPNMDNFNQNYWGWTYDAGDNGTWVNASAGNSGDITAP